MQNFIKSELLKSLDLVIKDPNWEVRTLWIKLLVFIAQKCEYLQHPLRFTNLSFIVAFQENISLVQKLVTMASDDNDEDVRRVVVEGLISLENRVLTQFMFLVQSLITFQKQRFKKPL